MTWAAIKKCEICGKRIGLWAGFHYKYQKEERGEPKETQEYIYGKFRCFIIPKDNEYDYAHEKCIIERGKLRDRKAEMEEFRRWAGQI